MENANWENVHGHNVLLANLLNQLLIANQTPDTSAMSDEDKFKAAYALNLCTVSVSQIIDYNDVNFLEHEYQAILNNLNLEEMPKDEALLHILKQLLDVITYFRIQEGEKKLLEKEYQQKMKNAIWNAVPNIGLIVAGGNPVTMAISLASQIGIGYMNYRKEKAKIGLEQERKEWELQRSAMEQFNGLRRELFDTAWRLADKYKFPDEYRLTERQITQYNRILMDSDDLRRYERLTYIMDNFRAYPPFWYYLGNAANAVAQNTDAYGEAICDDYKKLAKEAFKKFLDSTERNLLREDQLVASCALELFDLLEDNESERKVELLERAQRASGNAFDVLELCAMSYWKINETEKAANLFRMLVNEDYNTLINAQLLSRIYVAQTINDKSSESEKMYRTLQVRVGAENLFPMPPTKESAPYLDDIFIDTQKDNLREKFVAALTKFIKKYSEEYDSLCNSDGDISKSIIDLLEKMCCAAKKIVPDEAFVHPLQTTIRERRKEIQTMLICQKHGEQRMPAITFQMITGDAFMKLAGYIGKRIDRMNSMFLISEAEIELEKFCIMEDIDRIIPTFGDRKLSLGNIHPIAQALLDEKFRQKKAIMDTGEQCVNIAAAVKNAETLINYNKKGSMLFCVRGDHYFDTYVKKNEKALLECFGTTSQIIAILNDRSIWDRDLILSTDSITFLEKKKRKGRLTYSEVTKHYVHDGLRFGRHTFSNSSVNMSVLRELTDNLSSVQRIKQNVTDKNTADLIQSVKKAILQAPQPFVTKEELHSEDLNVLTQSGYNTSSVQNALLANVKTNSVIKEIVRLSDPDAPLMQLHGKVHEGKSTIGSYCTLLGQSGIYKIIKIGLAGDLTEAKVGKKTKFTLKRLG